MAWTFCFALAAQVATARQLAPLEALHKHVGSQLSQRLDSLHNDLAQLTDYLGAEALPPEQLEQVLQQFKNSYPAYVGVFSRVDDQFYTALPVALPVEARKSLNGLTLQDAPLGGEMGLIYLNDVVDGTWILFLYQGGSAERPVLAGACIQLTQLVAAVGRVLDDEVSGISLSTVDRKGRLVHAMLGDTEKRPELESENFVMDKKAMRISRRRSYSRSMDAAGTQWMLGLYYVEEPRSNDLPPLVGRWMGAYTEQEYGAEDLERLEKPGGKLEALSLQKESEVTLYLRGEQFTYSFKGLYAGEEVAGWEMDQKSEFPTVCSAVFDPVRKSLKGTLIERRGNILIKKAFYLLRASP